MSLIHFVSLALSKLELNPLAEDDMYKGDLLKVVSEIPQEFWHNNSDLNNRFVEIAGEVKILAETINNELLPKLMAFDYV